MDNLDPSISKLQDIFSNVGMNLRLPQIVAVGSQSSGKSSVIENLVGRSFLPRGAGIVTRRPLILQLLKDNVPRSSRKADWAIFQHLKDKIFTNFNEIREEIVKETKRVAGGNCGISSDPIVLKIYSARFVNLTLVDLPGLTRIPMGEQPEDVDHLIREIVLQYVRDPHCIVLAIVTANTDIATSESLKIAREVDSDGKRTIAVVTKLDIMDKGTDAKEMLLGQVIKVPLGIIGVVNRSQQDIVNDKSMEEALKDEERFFLTRYPTMVLRNGTSYLIKVLTALLKRHINEYLPELKQQVDALILQQQAIIDSLGGEKDTEEKNKTKLLFEMVSRFASSYVSALDGTSKEVETKELSGGARVNYIFHETFRGALNSIQPLGGLARPQILTAMKNVAGVQGASLRVPDRCFELLVKQQISRLLEPSLRCVDLVHKELKRIVSHCGSEVDTNMLRYPNLHRRIIEVTSELFNRCLPATNEMATNLVNIHLAYIDTLQPDFQHNANLASSMHSTLFEVLNSPTALRRRSSETCLSGTSRSLSAESSPMGFLFRAAEEERSADGKKLWSEKDVKDCAAIEFLVESYYINVRKAVQDTVPKAVMHFLVNYVKDNLKTVLLTELYEKSDEDLLEEAEDVVKRRKEAVTSLNELRGASELIDEISFLQIGRTII